MVVISIINEKGGVGKTTTSVNIAAIFTSLGKKVLLVDTDSQGNATSSLGIDKYSLKYTLYDLMRNLEFPEKYNSLKFKDVVINVNGIDVLPTNKKMEDYRTELGHYAGSENYLKDIFRQMNEEGVFYDIVLIDCPPKLPEITDVTLNASTHVLVPVVPDAFSFEGMTELIDKYKRIKRRLNPKLEILGIYISRANPRTNLFDTTEVLLTKYYSEERLKTFIREKEIIKFAPVEGKTILEFRTEPAKEAIEDYTNLCKEILEKLEKKGAI